MKLLSSAAMSTETTHATPVDDNAAVQQAVLEAVKILPFQGILENFVHQNPLAHFEHLPFGEGVHLVHELEK